MADAIQRTGDTGVQVTLNFPDGKSRDDFEGSFRGWLKEYQQRATAQRRAAYGAASGAGAEEEDVSGYLYEHYGADGEMTYVNFI